jgi:molecular chaperone HtpG
MSEEKLSFQAEVSRLLDIVANALYSNKEIFLRELISNASDACDRLRYLGLTDPSLTAADPELAIVLASDKKTGTLTITDNGVGMNREEMVENLGTIARSGTAQFLEEMENKKDGAGLIGKFGVGFYSAFMVADKVVVETRKAGEDTGWRWVSEGQGEFSIAESDAAPSRGTRITLHIKKDQKEFLDPTRLRQVIKTYSDHIAVPIRLDEEEGSINAASALWSRPKSEITDEQYKEFYHHVAHAFDEPWLRLHFKAEGVIEYTGLLFVPSSKPFDLFHPDRKGQIKLYVRRVFITDDCEELLPAYLRFLRGVIDSEDLPLNISRELLQHNPMLTKIKKGVTKRVLGELKKKADKDPEAYATFWDNFGAVLKEGIYEDEGERERLLELARFPSTGTEGPTSLADYVSRMKDGQEAIYYISGEDRETLLKSPQLEGFRAKGVEVLLFSDPVDDFWPTAVPTYADKPFKSVTRGGADLDKVQSAETKDDKEKAEDEGAIGTLLTFVKLALKDQVKDVRASQRLTESPVCLVADDGDLDMHLERVLKQHKQLDQTAPRVLELNPGHPLIKRLAEAVGNDAANANVEDAAHLLLDQARILEGETLPDPTAFSRRLASFMERGVV